MLFQVGLILVRKTARNGIVIDIALAMPPPFGPPSTRR
jgi:hypothetical protein